MKTAQEFLTEFAKDIIDTDDPRPIIAGWAKHMEAREKDLVANAEDFMAEAIQKRARQCNYQWEKIESFLQSYQYQKTADPHRIMAATRSWMERL